MVICDVCGAAPNMVNPGPTYHNVMSVSLILMWTAPHDNGGAITGYRVVMQTADGVFEDKITDTESDAKMASITGLTPFSSYRFKVAAMNAYGIGPYSEASESIQTSPGGSLSPFYSLSCRFPLFFLLWVLGCSC